MNEIEAKKLQEIFDDPVKWAQLFLRTYDPVKKKTTPWIARWYQAKALRDKSKKKVLRQGRRTGKVLPFCLKMREVA